MKNDFRESLGGESGERPERDACARAFLTAQIPAADCTPVFDHVPPGLEEARAAWRDEGDKRVSAKYLAGSRELGDFLDFAAEQISHAGKGKLGRKILEVVDSLRAVAEGEVQGERSHINQIGDNNIVLGRAHKALEAAVTFYEAQGRMWGNATKMLNAAIKGFDKGIEPDEYFDGPTQMGDFMGRMMFMGLMRIAGGEATGEVDIPDENKALAYSKQEVAHAAAMHKILSGIVLQQCKEHISAGILGETGHKKY